MLHEVRITRPRPWRICVAGGLALLHAEVLLTNAGAEAKSCRGGVVAPRRPDLECRPGEGSAGGRRVSGMKLGRQALNGQVEAQR